MSIEERPVLHVVGHDTKYLAASFLAGQTTQRVSDALSRIWINAYVELPDSIISYQSPQFVSDEWKTILIT